MTENAPERDEDARATDGAHVGPVSEDENAPGPVEDAPADEEPAQDATDAPETNERPEDDR